MDYDHNVANEYTAIGGATVLYDAAGNLTSDAAGYEYHYDYENRLTQVVYDSSPVGEFAYDALGRRIEKYDPSSDSLRTRYYYDGWRVLSEHDGDDENQPMFRYFVYGNYIDEMVMMWYDVGVWKS